MVGVEPPLTNGSTGRADVAGRQRVWTVGSHWAVTFGAKSAEWYALLASSSRFFCPASFVLLLFVLLLFVLQTLAGTGGSAGGGQASPGRPMLASSVFLPLND